jgi:ADP-ribose pyrophosphatase
MPPTRKQTRKPAAARTAKAAKPPKNRLAATAAKKSAAAPAKKSKVKLPKKKHIPTGAPELAEHAQIITSDVVYQGPLFRVTKDKIIEPSGKESLRDVVRHNGSVVILAVDTSKGKKDPWIVIERQYRHAANRYLWELPAGTLDPGEDPLAGAQRELEEETGYRAKKWKPLVEYFASPGFLGESMKVFVAQGLVPGEARPEEDEVIDFRLVKLSEVLKLIRDGGIMDGKTLSCVLLYHELTRKKKK